MFSTVFKIVFFIEFMAAVIVRNIYTARFRKLDLEIDKRSVADMVLLAVVGVGMVVPLVYVFSTALDFADYTAPLWLGWIGALAFALAVWLLWRSHHDLGKNWTPTLGIRKNHHLVTSGIFRTIRHPMYAAHLLWALAQVLMLHNWIAGFSFIILMVPHSLLRISAEEKMMIQQFGDQYLAYRRETGAIFPRMFSPMDGDR